MFNFIGKLLRNGKKFAVAIGAITEGLMAAHAHWEKHFPTPTEVASFEVVKQASSNETSTD